MNYRVVPLGGESQFDFNGVKFAGNKSFMFWKKRSTTSIQKIIVVLDKKYENTPVYDGVFVLSLKGLNNVSDLKEAIRIFLEVTGNQRVVFQFLVENDEQKKLAESLGSELGLSFEIQNMRKSTDQKLESMMESVKEQTNSDLSMNGKQMIQTYNNGILKQYTMNNGVAYENHGSFHSEEEKMMLLKEWMQDPVRAAELSKMSNEARNELLNKTILSNRKEHYLESASEESATHKVGEVAIQTASKEGGLVNAELGIVQNDPAKENLYSVVEQQGENVQVVNPNVVSSSIHTDSGLSSHSFDSRDSVNAYVNGSVQVENQDEQQRKVDKVFYIDEDYNLYDDTGKIIGKIGVDGYMPDYNTNTITKNGQVVGFIGDYKDMGKNQTNIYKKPKVRTLEKEMNYTEKSAAFVSLPVIIFVLSALLLIASVVLLFVVE